MNSSQNRDQRTPDKRTVVSNLSILDQSNRKSDAENYLQVSETKTPNVNRVPQYDQRRTFLEQFKNKNTDSQELSTNSGRPLSKISIIPTSKSGRNSPMKQNTGDEASKKTYPKKISQYLTTNERQPE